MKFSCYCGNGINLCLKKHKQPLSECERFCSTACLSNYIINSGEGVNFFRFRDSMRDCILDTPFEHWDKRLRRFFRSMSEAVTARYFDVMGIRWRYEEKTILLGGRSTYTPDFILPDHGFVVEVKGLWGGSAKAKIRRTIKLGLPVIIVPDYLVKKIRKAV